MTCEYTWPHHLMSSDREAVETIVNQHGFKDDVAYGKSKLFVRTPRTLFTLEQERAALIPILVLFLQKVGAPSHLGHTHTSEVTTYRTCRPRGFFPIKQLIDGRIPLSCFKLAPVESFLPCARDEYVAPGYVGLCICLPARILISHNNNLDN